MSKQAYYPEWSSIEKHPLPEWFDGAKLGVFIHWGPYSVPAWATQSGMFGEVDPDRHFPENPYAEWYQNSMRIEGSPTAKYHAETYGENFEYSEFAEMWKAENWNPTEWASLFKDSGARYVVLVTMHHDGFNLWPSESNPEFSVATMGPKRDIVGELTEEVRKKGLKMGHYYSGILNWRFTKEPIKTFEDIKYVHPTTYEFADYAYKQVMELIDLYKPDMLWNDIGWPEKGQDDLKHLFSHYYNVNPEGVVNDRWHIEKNAERWTFEPEEFYSWQDFYTEEYSELDEIPEYKWESTRGMGYSFSFNANESEDEVISLEELIHLLVDIVSKNGNLLINVGPKADGTIPRNQQDRLSGLGEWLDVYEEAIFDTKPWVISSEITDKEIPVRFTQKDGSLYAIFMGDLNESSENKFSIHTEKKVSNITALDPDQSIEWTIDGEEIILKNNSEVDVNASVIKIEFE